MLDIAFSPIRYGVISASTPRLASSETLQSQPASVAHPMYLDCFQKICRTSRRKSAARIRTAKHTQQRRERALINANEKTNQSEHQSRIEARFARRNHSCSSAR